MKVIWVGSESVVNGPVIFLAKGTKLHPRLRGTNLVTRYGFPEVSGVNPNKASYMDDETWAKVVKVVAPGIRKMAVSNVSFVSFILFSTYLTLHLCYSKFSADNLEVKIWIVRCIENKIVKIQATLLISIFLIPGATIITIFSY